MREDREEVERKNEKKLKNKDEKKRALLELIILYRFAILLSSKITINIDWIRSKYNLYKNINI